MIDHLKKWGLLHANIIVLVGLAALQAANHYLTSHPKVDFGALMGAMGWAVVNLLMKSPMQKGGNGNGDTSTTK